ncbi:CD164 sialomucin-like 2 protein [Pseudorasbora parva]|uniref:CD164 sialomucin-like 2 protein n=1 Tax=Pseudorasbora parva TaxID=51549 RepID=UPI00351EB3AA
MRCVLAALCGTVLLTQVIITNSQESDDSTTRDCSQFDSCDGCISGDPALNLTRCVWQSCNDGNDTRCMSDTEDFGGCSVYNETGMCQTDGGSADGGGKDNTTPEFSQASFDLSSFIGESSWCWCCKLGLSLPCGSSKRKTQPMKLSINLSEKRSHGWERK